ncbi:hypothetical protein VPH35_105498 [Triticum aestivum]
MAAAGVNILLQGLPNRGSPKSLATEHHEAARPRPIEIESMPAATPTYVMSFSRPDPKRLLLHRLTSPSIAIGGSMGRGGMVASHAGSPGRAGQRRVPTPWGWLWVEFSSVQFRAPLGVSNLSAFQRK